MEIKRIGSQPSGKGPADYFTGTVRIDPLFQAPDPARAIGASVTFEPGARLECDARATAARRFGRFEQRVDADRAGEIVRRSLA